MRDQEIPPPQEAQHRAHCERENILPSQAAPDRLQLQHTLERRIAGIIGAVDGADAGADHHVRGNPVRGKRVHHADLNGAKTAAAGEYKGGFLQAGFGDGQGVIAPAGLCEVRPRYISRSRGGGINLSSFRGALRARERISNAAVWSRGRRRARNDANGSILPQRSTNAFSITKRPGSLWLPSRKPRASNIAQFFQHAGAAAHHDAVGLGVQRRLADVVEQLLRR